MYLEPAKKLRPPSEDPSTGLRLGIILLAVFVLFGVLVFRLWFLQVLSGDQYLSLADDNRTRTVELEAPRGLIYDRNGKVLVENRAGLSVGVLPMDLPEDKEAEVISRLSSLLNTPADKLQAKVDKARGDPYRVTVLGEDVSETPTIAYLKEHSLEFPGIRVEKSYLRSYPRPAFAAHILGYTGQISETDMTNEKFKTLPPNSVVGKAGLEYQYDSYLRGINGSRTIEVDYQGRAKGVLDKLDATPGHNLVLTIDSTIQETAERAIKEEGIDRAHESGYPNADAGAVIAMDPRTGEILAVTSYPDYDPSIFANGLSKAEAAALYADDAHSPELNRAIGGLYPAASTFKTFVAATALQLNLVDPLGVFNCTGRFQLGPGQVLRCWNPDGHGEVNLTEAIMQSCDIYFYNLALLFNENTSGMQMQKGVKRFGFGSQTGIDLPGESSGRVPDDVWKKNNFTGENQTWMPGDDVNLSIGQGYLTITPMQLAVAYSAVANKGKLLTPHLAKSVTDSEGNIIHEFTTEVKDTLNLNDSMYDPLYKGLELVTQESLGTAYNAFQGFPIKVAGKTGTAEKLPDADYAWFVGFAPADNPEIVVVALVEQGGHGSSVAAPVVRRVMESYFQVESGGMGEIKATD